MTEEEKGELDVSNPVLGSIRAKGYRLMDLVCLFGIALMAYSVFLIQTHAADADRQVSATKAQQASTAETLKESNKAVADALKENNQAVTEAIREMAKEQRRANEIGREQTCLLGLPQDRRTNSAEFCKRLSRERDR